MGFSDSLFHHEQCIQPRDNVEDNGVSTAVQRYNHGISFAERHLINNSVAQILWHRTVETEEIRRATMRS